MEINQFQGITLYAFFEAVAQQTTPLPEDLKQKMSAVGDIFAQDTDTEIDTAINQLADLAQHPRLKPIYELTRQQIQLDYQPQELNDNLLNLIKSGQKVVNQPAEILSNLQSAIKSALKTPDLLLDDSQISSELRKNIRLNETTN